MPRSDKQKKRRRPRKKRRGRVFIAFERAVLGFGMSVVAFFIERRLIKAIKKGGVTAAPRIAAEPGEELGAAAPEQRQGEVTTSPSSG